MLKIILVRFWLLVISIQISVQSSIQLVDNREYEAISDGLWEFIKLAREENFPFFDQPVDFYRKSGEFSRSAYFLNTPSMEETTSNQFNSFDPFQPFTKSNTHYHRLLSCDKEHSSMILNQIYSTSLMAQVPEFHESRIAIGVSIRFISLVVDANFLVSYLLNFTF